MCMKKSIKENESKILYGAFYFSEGQKEITGKLDTTDKHRCFFKSKKTGEIMEYTEWCEFKKKTFAWDDMVFLGFGWYDHMEKW